MARRKQEVPTGIIRPSFIFYGSFYEAIDNCPIENQRDIYRAIALYALRGELMPLNGISKSIFAMAKPQLDANTQRYLNGCKGKEYGAKGGAKKGNNNAAKRHYVDPPTLEEVEGYFENGGLEADPQEFYEFYERRGWGFANPDITTWQQMANVWNRYPANKRPR